jgi:hypothetical protein
MTFYCEICNEEIPHEPYLFNDQQLCRECLDNAEYRAEREAEELETSEQEVES